VTLVGNGLKVAYAGAVALDGVDINVPAGEVTCVFGPNGAGKSSLLRALAGLVRVQSGEIEFEGRKITNLPAFKRAALGVALVPEGRSLFPELSVESNLLLGGYKLSPRARREAVESAYALFPGIGGRRKQLASTLSGGEQQMVAVARGLIAGPKVLMVDEPSLGLAPMVVEEIFQHLRELANRGLAVLLVEQNTRRALEIADRALVLHRGRVDMSGSADELRRSDWAETAYLGAQEDRRGA
jgi:branched-chain amino acid transport system ATP-binding protein